MKMLAKCILFTNGSTHDKYLCITLHMVSCSNDRLIEARLEERDWWSVLLQCKEING